MRRRIDPGLLRRGKRWIASIFRPEVDREVEEELDFHIEMRVREHRARGMDEEEARRRALAAFGDVDAVRARCARLAEGREGRMRRVAWMDELWQDLRSGTRRIVRDPAFAAATITTLALAIGANAAVFSVVHGVLLKPLPYEEPDELVALWTRYLPSTGIDIPQFPISAPEILDYRESSEAMEAVAPYSVGRSNLGGGTGDPVAARVLRAGRDLPSLLGVEPLHGRLFGPEEVRPGGPPAVILSHALWIERFGGDPDAVGRSVELDGRATPIVGVLPAGVSFPSEGIDLWSPLRLDEADPGSRGAHWLLAVGRLADGADLATAEAELETITAAWNEEWEHHASGHFLFLRPLRDEIVGPVRPALLSLLAVVGLVLLIACANVASLLLVRGEARSTEMAVRTALGAGRARLARQVLAEALLPAIIGGVLGVVIAWWGTPRLLAVDPRAIPRSAAVEVDGAVLGFTALVVVLATAASGLIPALRAGRGGGPGGELGGGSTRIAPGSSGSRKALVAAEVALSIVVVVGAGLVVRSFDNLRRADVGIREAAVATFSLELPASRYEGPDEVQAFYDALTRRLRALPGVVSAGGASVLPATGEDLRSDFQPEGAPPARPGVPAWNAQLRVVRPGFFESVGIPVERGRAPLPRDDATAPLVAWVDRATVERFWPGEDVVGRRLTFTLGAVEDGERPWLTVVGVVGDVLDRPSGSPEPHIWVPHAQVAAASLGTGRNMTFAVRASSDPSSLFPAVRRIVSELDASLPVSRLRTMESVLDAAVARERLTAHLFLIFAGAALLLAVVGVYGVVSYGVARRTREVGVRIALGAGRRRVLGRMWAEGMLPAGAGALVGVAAALLGSPLLADILFGVGPRDPATVGGATTVLLLVAAAAAFIPAVRATRIEPARALREE